MECGASDFGLGEHVRDDVIALTHRPLHVRAVVNGHGAGEEVVADAAPKSSHGRISVCSVVGDVVHNGVEAAIAESCRECLAILEIDLDVLHSANDIRLQIPARDDRNLVAPREQPLRNSPADVAGSPSTRIFIVCPSSSS